MRFLAVGSALLGLALLARPGAGGGGGKEKDRPALSPDVFKKLVSHDVKLLKEELTRGSFDVKTGRKVRALAFMIAVYADAALDSGRLDAMALATLRTNALDLVARAEEGKGPINAALLARLSPNLKLGGKKKGLGAPGKKGEAVAWAQKLGFDDLMHQFTSPRVGGLGLEKELSDLAESKEEFSLKQLDRLILLGHRLAMIGRATESYAAEQQGGPKTRQLWHNFARQMRDASLTLVDAARAGKSYFLFKVAASCSLSSALGDAALQRSDATRAALDRVNTTCVKCHDAFRQ
jgi:hypothetical protein